MFRQYSFLDQMVNSLDDGLKTLVLGYCAHDVVRKSPAEGGEPILTEHEARHVAGLMRINHAGEVCAQALYQGQALTARNPDLKQQMLAAALEEQDHLSWCYKRLIELNSRPSFLNFAWYFGALGLGVLAGIAGDKWSLGFLNETELQVALHLENHLLQLPSQDLKSIAIIKQMKIDETLHAQLAQTSGAAKLPGIIKYAMRMMSRVMTTVAYRI